MVASLVVVVAGAGAAGLAVSSVATHEVFQEALVAPAGPSDLSSLLDPSNSVSQAVAALAQPGLLQLSSKGTAELGLASKWKKEDGGSRYAFSLSTTARWSNGQRVTTRDVGFTLAVLQSKDFTDPSLAAAWSGVSLYANSYWSGTLVLPAPSPTFPTAAEDAILPAAHYHDQPQLFLQGGQRTTSSFPPSAGPFTVSANTQDQVVLQRNSFFRPAPILAGFAFDLEPNATAVAEQFAKGGVDGWMAATPTDLRGLPKGIAEERMTSYSFVVLLMNEQSGPLANLNVRRAIASAVDRPRLIAAGLGGLGLPQYGPLPDSIPWAALRERSVGALPSTGSLLEAAGYSKTGPVLGFSKGGKRLSFILSVPNVDPLPTAADALAQMLAKKGIPVTVQVDPSPSFVAGPLTSEGFQLALVGFDNGPDPNLTSFWGSLQGTGQSLNFTKAPADPVLNHQLDQLATATTTAAKAAAYREVTARLIQDMPGVFLYTPVAVYVHLTSVNVPGIPASGDPNQRFQDVVNWSL